jgi:pimeloyl-ACP methyl ester carboxylesterase
MAASAAHGEPERLTVTTTDSRSLEVLVEGPADGFPVVYHSGTPSAAVSYPPLSQAAAAHGLRTVTLSRAGYGESTAKPGRAVADVTADVDAVLAALGLEQFVTFGWSGGGPHALACAALMGDGCRGVAILAGVAPFDASGLDWLDGMGAENIAEFGAAAAGKAALTEYLQSQCEELADVTDDHVAASLGDLASEVDRRAITGELASYLAASFRHAVRQGPSGWRDDDLALVRPWGFELDTIAVPVAVWQGRLDRMVPFTHGQWLASHVAGASAHLYDDEGHLSLLSQFPRIFADLADMAGLG